MKPVKPPLLFKQEFHGFTCPSLKFETFCWFALGGLSHRQTSVQGTRKQGLSVLYLSEQVHKSEIAKLIHPLATVRSGLWKVKICKGKNKRYRLMEYSQFRGDFLTAPFLYVQPQHTLLEA